jgi:hypothetical protein
MVCGNRVERDRKGRRADPILRRRSRIHATTIEAIDSPVRAPRGASGNYLIANAMAWRSIWNDAGQRVRRDLAFFAAADRQSVVAQTTGATYTAYFVSRLSARQLLEPKTGDHDRRHQSCCATVWRARDRAATLSGPGADDDDRLARIRLKHDVLHHRGTAKSE